MLNPPVRRTNLQVLAAALLLTLSATARAGKPNIVFVLFDDLGYGQPPAYRSETTFKLPNLDRLVREGMRFTRRCGNRNAAFMKEDAAFRSSPAGRAR